MKNKLKSALLLSVTMLLGIILGVLISFKIVNYRIEQAYNDFSKGNLLINKLEKSVTFNKGQKEKIQEIIEKHRPQFNALLESSREETRKLIDTFMKDLEEVLSKEQINDLKSSRFLRRRARDNGLTGQRNNLR